MTRILSASLPVGGMLRQVAAACALARRPPLCSVTPRIFLSSDADNSAESIAREDRMRALLSEHFKPTHLLIQDVSGTRKSTWLLDKWVQA